MGGQFLPNSILGDKLLWKKAQKKEIKKKISDKIKSIIPNFKPCKTNFVWKPCNDASREISRHHWKEDKINKNNAIKINSLSL